MTLLYMFTRYVMIFKIVNQLKDGLYKLKHYYWIAGYIILRNVFSALPMSTTETRLITETIILS